jgi:hypothetical protein
MSSCCEDTAFWSEQLENTKKLVVAFNAAILAVASGKQSYQVDTGQTRILVTKANLTSIRDARAELLNEVATLEARLGCGGSTHIVPGF